ncbi:MAG: autotransporter-associated beta strand repeat-containing protein, partial [Kiritimatiellae bacterium]|nr:autotransporter-associated beta strand repeat-containing protein [Kiritimatiellia bacterium]
MALGILLFSGVVFNAGAADFYWRGGSSSSDNIDQDDNWWTAGHPASGDNLYFNSAAGRTWAYNNYGGGSWFDNLISYNGAPEIRYRGDLTWLYKFENNNNGNLFYAEANLENRGGSPLEINPVGSGGVRVGNVNLYNATELKIYGDNTLTIAGNVTESGTAGSTMHLYGGATVVMNGQNTFTGDLTIDKGVVELNNTTDPLACDISLGATSGSDDAVLQINAASVDVDSDITVETGSSGTTYIKNVNAGSAEFSGDITLDKNVTINVTSGGTLEMSGVISGSDKLITFNDTGTAVLSGVNTFGGGDGTGAGGVYVQQGTLKVSSDNNLGTDPSGDDANYIQLNNWATLHATASFTLDTEKGITLTGNGSIGVDDTYTLTYAGDIAGGNEFSKKGAGTLKISSGSAITASQIYIDAGTLWATATQPFDGTASTINLGPNGGAGSAKLILGSAASSKSMDEGVTVRAGDDMKYLENGNTGGNCNFNGKINLKDDLTVNAVGGSIVVLAGGVDMSANGDNNSDLTISGANDVTISGVMEADGGDADLNFNGSGTLLLSADNASTVVNWMKINIGGGGTLQISAANNLGDDPIAAYNDKMNFHTSGGTLYNTADVTLNSDFGMSIADGVTATFEVGDGSTDDLTINGVIWDTANNGQVVKTGPGTLWLLGANTFGGAVTVNAGALRIAADSGLGDNNQTLTLNGGKLYAGADVTINSSRGITLGASGGSFGGLGTSDFTFDGVIDGTGDLTKEDSDWLSLGGANTFTGTINVDGGTLRFTSDGNLGNTANDINISNGAEFYLYSGAGSVSLNSGRNIVLGASGGKITTYSSTTLTVPGDISGSTALTKDGSGTLILTGNNTYSGGTTISSGTLQGTTDGLQGDIVNGGAVIFNQAGAGTYAGAISSSGTLTKNGIGNVTLSGVNTYSGNTTVNAGTLTVSGSAANSAFTVGASGTLAGDGAIGTLGLSGKIAPNDGNHIAAFACGNTTMEGGGGFICSLGDCTDTSDRDYLNVGSGTGTVTLNNTSGDKFTIYLADDALANFNTSSTYSWTIVDAGTLTTFAADKFAIDTTTYWTTSLGGGAFTLSESSGDMVLTFTPGSAAPTLIDPTDTDIASTTATLGATLQDNGGDTVTDYGVVWGTSTAPTTGDNKVQKSTTEPAMPSVFTVSATGLPAGTLIYYRGYGINTVGTAYSSEDSFYTLSTEPSTHVTGLTFSGNEVSANLNWTAATGANGYLVLRRDGGSAPTGTPSDGQSYSVGNTIGDGTVAAVVTDGSTAASISSLTRETQYSFTVIAFAWDTSHGATCNYRTTATIPSVSGYTLAVNPTGDPTGLGFTCAGFSGLTSITISWTKGTTATNTLVAMEEGSAGIGGAPVDQTAYSADTVFGAGDTLQAGEYVVYSSDGSSVTVTGLNPDTTYTVKLWSYNGSRAETLNYRLTSPPTGSQATIAPPEAQNPGTANPTTAWLGDTLDLHVNAWQNWESNARNWATVFGRWDNADIASSSVEGAGRSTAGDSTDDTYAATPQFTQTGTFYYALRISYQFGNDFYYWLDDGTDWNDMSLSLPSAAEHSIVVSALNNPTPGTAVTNTANPDSAINLTWAKDAQSHWVMIVRNTADSWEAPTQGTVYSAGNSIGSGTVIYKGGDLIYTNTGLDADTTYYYKIYTENNNYYSSGAATLSATTASHQPKTVYWRVDSATTNWWDDSNHGWWYPDGVTTRNRPDYTGANILRFDNTNNGIMSVNGAMFLANQMLFQDGTVARTLNTAEDGTIDFQGSGAKIENADADTMTFNVPINMETNLQMNLASGDMTFNHAITNGGNDLSVYGAASKMLTLAGVVSGAGGFSLEEATKVKISGASTYTGDTEVNAGEFWISSGGSLKTPVIRLGDAVAATEVKVWIESTGTEVTNDITVRGAGDWSRYLGGLNGAGEVTYSGNISVSNHVFFEANQDGGTLVFSGPISGDADQHIVMTGPGTKKITHANNYPGDTLIDRGVVALPLSGSLGSGGHIDLGSATHPTMTAKIQLSEATGGQVLTNNINVADSDNIGEKRTIESLNTEGTSSYLGTVTHDNAGENLRLYVLPGGTLALSNTVSGAGQLWMQQEGTVKLAGNNTYSGGSYLDRGLTYLTHNNAAGQGGIYLGADPWMDASPILEFAAGLTVTNNITSRPANTNIVTISTDGGSGDVTLSGTLTLTKDIEEDTDTRVTYVSNNLASGSVVIDTLSLNNGGALQNDNRFIFIDGAVTIKDVIDPPTNTHRGLVMRLAPEQSGELTLDGTNNANFYLDSGDVVWGSSFALGASALEFQVGTTDNVGEADKDASVAFTEAGDYTVDFIVGFRTNSAGLTGTRMMEFKHSSGTVTVDGKMTLHQTDGAGKFLYISNVYPAEITGAISGPAGVRKQGAGYLTFSGEATYEGDTYVDNGTLKLADFSGDVGTVFLNGEANNTTLYIQPGATSEVPVRSLVGAGTRTIGTDEAGEASTFKAAIMVSNAMTAFTAPESQTVLFEAPGSISGTGGVEKVGTGWVVFRGANTYSALTEVDAGVLSVEHADALGGVGSGTVVANGAALEIKGGITMAAEPLTLNGAGATASPGGALRNVGDANDYAGPVTLASDSSIGTDVGTTLTNSGVISGGFALTKVGAGTLILTEANTYTGDTTVEAGVLNIRNNTSLGTVAGDTEVAADAALQVQGDITVGADESLEIEGTGESNDGVIRNISGVNALGGAVTLNGNSTLGVDAGTLTLSGIINEASDSHNLTKVGNGTLILSGDNLVGGTLTVSAGLVQVGHEDALDATSAKTIVSGTGSAVDLNGYDVGAEPMDISGTGIA